MNYKITLSPLERFFFGGENVLGGGDNAQDERRRSYLVKSNILPQQTTLLGMLREQLLIQNGLLLPADPTAEQLKQAEALIGSSGFSPQKNADPYGLIQALSPVVITDDSGQIWQPAPLDDREMPQKVKPEEACARETQPKPLTFAIDPKAGKPMLLNLNPKEDMDLCFGTANGQRKPLSGFFQSYDQVGITMTNRLKHLGLSKVERKEAYYRQTQLGNGTSAFAQDRDSTRYSFTFWVKMAEEMQGYKLTDSLVYMGGERSAFQMSVTALPDTPDLQDYLPKVQYRFNQMDPALAQRYQRIVLLSDAYVDWAQIQEHCAFAVTQTTPFRYFTTVLGKTSRFYDFNKNDPAARQQSGMHTLLLRGSVLYAEGQEKVQQITGLLGDQAAFQRLGYNYFQTI